jgi:hypothetical protein
MLHESADCCLKATTTDIAPVCTGYAVYSVGNGRKLFFLLNSLTVPFILEHSRHF